MGRCIDVTKRKMRVFKVRDLVKAQPLTNKPLWKKPDFPHATSKKADSDRS